MIKKLWSNGKEILFAFLALSKMFYWYYGIIEMNQSHLDGAREAILMRLLERDLLLIGYVVIFFFLYNLIFQRQSSRGTLAKYAMLYGLGFFIVLGYFYLYLWALSWFFPINWPPLIETLANGAVTYVVIVIALHVKERFKAKGKEEPVPSAETGEDRLSMLRILLEDGLLTREEFEEKKAKLLEM